MNWRYPFPQLSSLISRHWFIISLIGIFLFSLLLRFWKLSQFNTLVFDEVYYAKFANDYLTGRKFFQSHPPLSQYLIAFGIWLGSFFPASPDTINNLTGSLRSTFSYRWLNAFIGSFFPLVFAGIAYQLTFRRTVAVIAALLVALDGLFLVESRYALNNIYLVIFGLLGQLLFLIALNNPSCRWRFLILSGISFGCSASIKWNGLGFLLGIFLLIFISYIQIPHFLRVILNRLAREKQNGSDSIPINILQKCQSFNWLIILITLVLIPIITYSLLWIPHLILNPEYNFFQVNQEIYAFHQRIGGNNRDVHPYCSAWYSWLIMWRPVAYYYDKKIVAGQSNIIYDVHAIANPFLLWASTLAIVLVFYLLLTKFLRKVGNSNKQYNWDITLYLAVNYLANLLPWLKISRCTFFYHYMAAYSFAILALAWIIDTCLKSRFSLDKITAKIMLLIIIISFIHWLPIYLGLPLSELGFKIRILFPNWV
jgi:dolichyl-phosphate-mannose--protein O-mannosyl transferase